jgi:hypothetical protein
VSEKRIDFVGRLDGRTELGDGSVRFTARLTRTGVFDYGDHRELRTADEVFKEDALASFKGLTVTDGHRAWIDAANWDEHAIGHVGDDVKQDGEFVVASVIVKDRGALAKVDAGELAEISMGYAVNLEAAPGQTAAGEKYDSIQRDIRGNHAALGPVDWGRAGPSVRLLDGAAYGRDMTTPAQRIDAPAATNEDQVRKDLDASRADADAVRKERDTARAERDAARKDAADAAKRADTAEAERDATKKEVEKAKADAAETAKKEAARVDARVTLLDSARGILGAETSFVGKTDREVRIAALVKVDSTANFDGKSDDYVTAAFDIAVKSVKTDRAALGELNESTALPAAKADATESEVDKSKRENAERTANAWKPKAKK